jgi:hypothetical protein
MEPAEAGECNFFSPEIHELTTRVVVMKDPTISNFHSNYHHHHPHTVQDLKIIVVIHYDTR